MPSVDEMQHLIKFCEVLAKAPFYAKMGAPGVLAVYLTAKEMNLPLMTCLNGGLYTFDGKVTMSAQLMNMLIVNAGHKANVLRLDDTICEIEFVRCDRKGDDAKFRYSFSMEQAQKAGYLSKDNWRKHPRDMLFARALSGGARKFMPDVLMNAYVFGELDDEASETPITEPYTIPSYPNAPLPDGFYLEPNQEEIKAIEQKHESYDLFCVKHDIIEGSESWDYVMDVCQRGNLTRVEVVNSSIKNPERFLTGFDKWKNKRHKDKKDKNDKQ